jgi:deoxyribose-phosphate aldolase
MRQNNEKVITSTPDLTTKRTNQKKDTFIQTPAKNVSSQTGKYHFANKQSDQQIKKDIIQKSSIVLPKETLLV